MSLDRRAVLAAFIRSQVALTDKHPHVPGPGSVHLNHEEATLAAECLELCATSGDSLDAVTRRHVELVLKSCNGDKRAAVQVLGISLKTLYNYLHEWGAM